MFNQFSIIFGRQWHTYTLALLFGICLSLAWMLFRSTPQNRGRVFDVCLAALIGGVLLGRGLHVILNWEFFADRLELIWQLHREGGLNWQATVIGALIADYTMAKFRKLELTPLLTNAVIILPFLAFMSYYACATASCA